MSEFLRAVFTTWDIQPALFIVPTLFAILYLRGWQRLYRLTSGRTDSRRRVRRLNGQPVISGGRLADPWRPVAYFSGLAVLFVALYSGLDAYASLLFFVHMIQHLLILMIVPPLIWLGNPYPFVMWGLPRFAASAYERPAGGALALPPVIAATDDPHAELALSGGGGLDLA